MKPARFMPRELRPAALELRLYYSVLVFGAPAFLCAHVARRRPSDTVSKNFAAIVLPDCRLTYGADGAGKLKPKLGELCLRADRLGTAVLSHESVHLALDTLRSVGQAQHQDAQRFLALGDGIDAREERLAYLTCGLCRQIVDGLYDLGYLGQRRNS